MSLIKCSCVHHCRSGSAVHGNDQSENHFCRGALQPHQQSATPRGGQPVVVFLLAEGCSLMQCSFVHHCRSGSAVHGNDQSENHFCRGALQPHQQSATPRGGQPVVVFLLAEGCSLMQCSFVHHCTPGGAVHGNRRQRTIATGAGS